jgi:hypothetical protein
MNRIIGVEFGHHGRAALLAADDQLDVAGVVERVEHRQIALAGDGEHPVDTVEPQLLDQDLGAAAPLCRAHGAAAGLRFGVGKGAAPAALVEGVMGSCRRFSFAVLPVAPRP